MRFETKLNDLSAALVVCCDAARGALAAVRAAAEAAAAAAAAAREEAARAREASAGAWNAAVDTLQSLEEQQYRTPPPQLSSAMSTLPFPSEAEGAYTRGFIMGEQSGESLRDFSPSPALSAEQLRGLQDAVTAAVAEGQRRLEEQAATSRMSRAETGRGESWGDGFRNGGNGAGVRAEEEAMYETRSAYAMDTQSEGAEVYDRRYAMDNQSEEEDVSRALAQALDRIAEVRLFVCRLAIRRDLQCHGFELSHDTVPVDPTVLGSAANSAVQIDHPKNNHV